MLNPIKEITKWQVDAGNSAKPYDDFLESSFQVEEALENFGNLHILSAVIDEPELEDSPKLISRKLVNIAQGSNPAPISDVDRLDKACDAIVYAIGSMTKLGLDHHGITKALNIVNVANKAKTGMARDPEGKLLKPADFVGPEPELQKLLDARSK